jgi:polyhydroxyalkanoate synthesis regulator phasin
MDEATRAFVLEQCLQTEQKSEERLQDEIAIIGQIIKETIAKKEDLESLQEQIDELRGSK